jgi:ATP/maltotriose-dependent transcriptional regulator MalT
VTIEDRKIPCLWYQVEEGDKDPATFFYYLGQAAKNAFPKRKILLPLFTLEYSRGLPTFTQNFFEKLFSWMKTPSVLVFDNFQEAPEESPLPEIFLNGLSRIPEGVNFMVLSRRDPPESLIPFGPIISWASWGGMGFG